MENYQFIQQIGHGSYGEIWLVKCSKTRKKHVLKRIDLHQASKRVQRAAHLEAKLLSTIKHPNILTYLDSFHNSCGSLFIVMNYCECGDLYTHIKNQNGIHFEEKQIVHWFVQICLALKYLHDRNILHKNLKTSNIFLTKNKVIKVGDLGISKVLSITHEMTPTLIETPYYISPEIFDGEPYSKKSDIWALGCCTYEMTALKHPFIAPSIHSLSKKIMKRKLPSIPKMYSSELFDIISAMLNQTLDERPSVTSLLLNDYIRRYILFILQDNSKSSNSQFSENSCMLPAEESMSNSDLSLLVPKERLDAESSMSKRFLQRNTSKGTKLSGATPKKIANSTKAMIISVPDVNGNGDGNDNSQHRRVINANKSVGLSRKSGVVISENVNQCSAKFDNYTKKAIKHTVSQNINVSYNKLKNDITNPTTEQKRKGEISFQILNNLAYLLHTTRQENFMDNSSYISNGNSGFEPINLNTRFPTPTEDCCGDKYSVIHTKKVAINGNIYKDIPKLNHESNVCPLPIIRNETQNKKEYKSMHPAKK